MGIVATEMGNFALEIKTIHTRPRIEALFLKKSWYRSWSSPFRNFCSTFAITFLVYFSIGQRIFEVYLSKNLVYLTAGII